MFRKFSERFITNFRFYSLFCDNGHAWSIEVVELKSNWYIKLVAFTFTQIPFRKV